MYSEETVDRESQQKLYVQILSIIKGKIDKGEWTMGSRIPTEDELCRSYEVSKATVRIAVSELVREGYLKKWQGKGTFVTNSMPQLGMAMRTRLTENIFGEGVRTRKEIISRGFKRPEADVMSLFDAEDGIYHILCRRVVEDEPACLDESFLPKAFIPDIEGIREEEICGSSFYDLIQKKSIRRVHKVFQNIELGVVDEERAKVLKVPAGSPAMLLHRLFLGSDERPIAYTRLYGNGHRYRIQTEFERIR
jgi:GntR family transcriptional regulator